MDTYFHAKTSIPFFHQGICSQVFPCNEVVKGFTRRFFPSSESGSLGANSNTFNIFWRDICIWKINKIVFGDIETLPKCLHEKLIPNFMNFWPIKPVLNNLFDYKFLMEFVYRFLWKHAYRISSHNIPGNYSFLNLEIVANLLWKLFKGGSYSRAETIWGNAVLILKTYFS